ncbi:Retrovirus-related Pol polyprotein from transposon TNT 1-94 [Glycine max]|nr:Retrovirus-related Pol polyprotein from transposon TNT 1-94 [Glycine max]
MVNTIKIEKFTGNNSFNLTHIKMRAFYKRKRHICEFSYLCLDEVLYEIYEELTIVELWLKLEKLFMIKSICNKIRKGMSLKEHLDELSYVLMELHNIDDKMENKDLTIILLASLPPSYENFVSSFSIGRDSITLEEVKSSFYFREFQLKAFRNVGEASVSRLSMTNSAKG